MNKTNIVTFKNCIQNSLKDTNDFKSIFEISPYNINIDFFTESKREHNNILQGPCKVFHPKCRNCTSIDYFNNHHSKVNHNV